MPNKASRYKLDTVIATIWIIISQIAAFIAGGGDPGLTIVCMVCFPGIPGALMIAYVIIKDWW